MDLIKYYRTIKHLKFRQIFYRIYYRVIPVKNVHAEVAQLNGWVWDGPNVNPKSMLAENSVSFLGVRADISSPSCWNDPSFSKLWLYNLHYFDDLNAHDFANRQALHTQFIHRWIEENPPCIGNGWEPYPLSLRLINWVKWISKTQFKDERVLSSMTLQASVLNQRLEYHILGNHLFANVKALIFVACLLDSAQTRSFLKKSLRILDEQLDEQFLEDGAHFELSPMYHCILLWDLLELVNLSNVSNQLLPEKTVNKLRLKTELALEWLVNMTHMDGNISFFNDAAFGIAPAPKLIFEYANSLDFVIPKVKIGLTSKPNSGYSRVSTSKYDLIFDHARIGPDYLPGHAHADSLSFEFSVGEQRVFVNSGTSLYGTSPERLRQRQSAAHNTVIVANHDSSEVWSGFRVARRAYCTLHQSAEVAGKYVLEASHDGYKRLSPGVTHNRRITCGENGFDLIDEVSGEFKSSFYLHIHPNIEVMQMTEKDLVLILPDKRKLALTSSSEIALEDATWHPEFGQSVANLRIKIDFDNQYLSTKIEIMKEIN